MLDSDAGNYLKYTVIPIWKYPETGRSTITDSIVFQP